LADFLTSGYTERPEKCLPRIEVRKNKNGVWFSQILIIHRSSFIIFFFSSSLLRFFSSAFPRFPVFAHLLTLLTSHLLLFPRFLSSSLPLFPFPALIHSFGHLHLGSFLNGLCQNFPINDLTYRPDSIKIVL